MKPVATDISVDRRSVVSLMSRLRASRGQANPYPLYGELRAMGNVVPAPWGGYLLTGFDVCDQVLRDRKWMTLDAEWRARQGDGNRWNAPASQLLGRTLVGLNPPHHTRQRRSLGNLFGRAPLNQLRSQVTETVDLLLTDLATQLREGVEADFASVVGEKLPSSTIGGWLRIPPADHALLRQLTHDQAYAQELLPSASQLTRANAAADGLFDYFTELIGERRKALGNDVLSTWIRTWDGLEPDRETADMAVYHLVMFLVIASLETTSTLLSTMVWLLAQQPPTRQWLRTHPEDVPKAVEEVLRYDPPVHLTTRAAAEDTYLDGVHILKGQAVHVMTAAANHDPVHTADPGSFDIQRVGPHLGFGGGIHYCVGAALARTQAVALLSALIERFPTLRVTSPPVWEPRIVFRRLTALHVAER